MKFDITITNFGKLKDAKVKIRPFTVIAGPNSSGKSFITKSLYSIFSTINIDHLTDEAYKQVNNLERLTIFLSERITRLSQHEDFLFHLLLKKIKLTKSSIDDIFASNTFSEQVSSSFLLKESIDGVEKSYANLLSEVSRKEKYKKVIGEFDTIKSIINTIKIISENPIKFIADGIQGGVVNSLKDNFQVTTIDDLRNYNSDVDAEVNFDLDKLGNLSIKSGRLDFKLNPNSIDEMQKLYNVVYLESPIYWKLKDALDSLRNRGLFSTFGKGGKDILTGVPKYFYDLLDLLSKKVKKDEEHRLSNQSIRDGIGGELVISDSGDISFKEDNSLKNVNLHSTALGIVNLGLISLLIEKNIIAKGSFLFLDEPEAHLHPAWQKLMIDSLFELSKQGINIVIATHSIDMMKSLENIVDEEIGLLENDHFGINQLSCDGKSLNFDMSVKQKISAIKSDLGKPFYDMFIDSNLLD